MPEMLREWRKKKSWKTTLPLCRMYASKKHNRKGMSLRDMCRLEKKLTLNKQTGFNELIICEYAPEIPKTKRYLTRPLPRYPSNMITSQIAKRLVGAMENYFIENWDSNKFHFILCSAGLDSRIMSWVLARLRKKRGRRWLGKVHFRCHEPEGLLFKKSMVKQGWKPSEYSVYKQGKFRQASYFDIGLFKNHVNGFNNPLAEFWGDLLIDEKDTVLVTGSGGGELFSYPLFSHWKFSANRYNDLVYNTRSIIISVHRAYHRWQDLLSPFISYRYLDVAFKVPKKHFKWVKANCYSTVNPYNTWQRRDLMRMAILKQFKDNIPLFVGHEYNLRITQQRANLMKQKYRESKFYRNFKHIGYVKNAQPWNVYLKGRVSEVLKSLDAKLYGYATMYEGV